MRSKSKFFLIVASVALCIAVMVSVVLYRPKRTVVIDVKGLSNRTVDAFIVVDGREQRHTVTLPRRFTFYARDVSYRVTPLDTSADDEMTGRIYTDDGFCDGSCTGWSVGGRVACSNAVRIYPGWSRGGTWVTTYNKGSPGPEVTTRLQ